MVTIVVVGQTPPPYHGQAMMIRTMLEGTYGRFQLVHVRMSFSKDFAEMKKWRFHKLTELFRVVWKILAVQFRYQATILYYPPSGPDLLPVLRDVFILLMTRWCFAKTIFHFHACGVGKLFSRHSWPLRGLFRIALSSPDVAIRPSEYAENDGQVLLAKVQVVVPNGVDDHCKRFLTKIAERGKSEPKILYVGMLDEQKGIMVLLAAANALKTAGEIFKVQLVGRFVSPGFAQEVGEYVATHDLAPYVELLGVLTGDRKNERFASADLFVFPSHYEIETFGIVLIEAMSFGLPVVATQWSGIQSIVSDGETGFLVGIKDANALAKTIRSLLRDSSLRKAMGEAGRRRFLEKYTSDQYRAGLLRAFELTESG